ncbi:hypothetical protein [Massilia horti]|uniref:Uncharacterized protein n=1 Tax=Massilia horti TaxID=2562153 RepID=A0A4Y9SW29_9BURK|nr:hypothetical protein [Massilia horti]TFW28936.1 hypothetical protein E4O92_20105 [Massilia horti]
MFTEKSIELRVTFVDLGCNEQPPQFGAYQLDDAGRPIRKIGAYDGKVFRIEPANVQLFALGPNVDDLSSLQADNLITYRLPQKIDEWRNGAVLARDIWSRFIPLFTCVTGTVRKCRPWYWQLFDDIRLAPALSLMQSTRIKPITAEVNQHIVFPFGCLPVCDGMVEVYERECCCPYIPIPILLDRLREILRHLPIPLPDPIPTGPDPTPITARMVQTQASTLQARAAQLDFSAIPPENLHTDYLALRTMSNEMATQYVQQRTYLWPLFCQCSVRKVAQTSIQPGGRFDVCFLRPPRRPNCVITYAYKVKQIINGVLTVVYDGLAAHQYFGASEPANIRTYNPVVRTCADGPGYPPPNDGAPFVMLEYVTGPGTRHFNFPVQKGEKQVDTLGANHGTYTTSYAPDCPWATRLGLRLWFSPDLEPIATYYRLTAYAVDSASGLAVGAPNVLKDSVTWDKFVTDQIVGPETLGPVSVGTEQNLFRIPYWNNTDHRYLSGQFHQVWNTASSNFPDGKYMLIIEVFDKSGNRIKPTGAPGAGTPANFQFRRWQSAIETQSVPFADVAHIFWIDNTPVSGKIVDLRKGGIANTGECQYMSGPGSTTFAIGFKAYHVHGVTTYPTSPDDDSFMASYSIHWQRGLNGNTGTLGPAAGGNNHTDVGEDGVPVSSGTETFANMLTSMGTVLQRCTFSVSLYVAAKHFDGYGRISAYDYPQTASFALEITG